MSEQVSAPDKWKSVVVLAAGLTAVSSGSILVRFSAEAPSLTIAFYRMAWATLLLTPFFWLRPGRRPIGWSPFLLAASAALAFHFGFWIASLEFTSVAVSVLLVNTSPFLVALFARFLFREKLTLGGLAGLGLSLTGSLLLVWNDLSLLGDWRGAMLALLGALGLAIYLLAGRKLRPRLSLLDYVYPIYLSAALILLAGCLIFQTELRGFSTRTHGYLFLLGLVPQCIGHTSYNWSLRFLPATLVATLVLAEPLLASLFAWRLLDEQITALVAGGGFMIGCGILLISLGGISRPEPTTQTGQENPSE